MLTNEKKQAIRASSLLPSNPLVNYIFGKGFKICCEILTGLGVLGLVGHELKRLVCELDLKQSNLTLICDDQQGLIPLTDNHDKKNTANANTADHLSASTG